MRRTVNFYLSVSCLMMMVQGFKSEQPSESRERRLVPGRSTNCDMCIDQRIRKDSIVRGESMERSRQQSGQIDRRIERERTFNPETRLYRTRDEVRTRMHGVSEERTRAVGRTDKTGRQYAQRERESDRYRRFNAINDKRRDDRIADLKNRDAGSERTTEQRSQSRSDRSTVRRINNRVGEFRNEQVIENREIHSQRRADNNLDETRDMNIKATGSSHRNLRPTRIDSRRLDGERLRIQRQPVRSSKLTNRERMEERTLTERREITANRQCRVGERKEHYRSQDRRAITTAGLQEIDIRRREITPVDDRVNTRNEARRISRFRNEQLSMIQRRELSERIDRSPLQGDSRLSSKRDNSRRASHGSTARLSDMRRGVTPSRKDHRQRQGMDDSSKEDRRQGMDSSERRRNQLRDNSLRYPVDDNSMNRRRESRFDTVRLQNRVIGGDNNKRLNTVRQININGSDTLTDFYHFNKQRRTEYRQVRDLHENKARQIRITETNLNVDRKDQRRESRLESRTGMAQTAVRSQVNENRIRRDTRFVLERSTTDRRLQIQTPALKTRCLNRPGTERDDRRRNGNVVLSDGRMGLKGFTDERRRDISNRREHFKDGPLKHWQTPIISDSSMKTPFQAKSWSTQFISFDGWSVTRAIVVGFVGIMGRSLWQKQI